MAANISPMWNAFNAGELSSKLDGRTDQDKYFAGCKRILNFIPTVQGPAYRRAGTRYRGTTKSNGRAWFSTFEQSVTQSYVLEFGNNYLRWWVNRGQLTSGGSPYEISTPWTGADLITDDASFALRSVQSSDIMWLVNTFGNVAPQKLSRFGATSWTLASVPFVNGPFHDTNPDETTTIRASASTGSGITLTASSSIFTVADVGTSFYLEMQDPGLVLPWATVQTTAVNDLVRYQGNFYKATAVGTTLKTGINPPVHTDGSASDGLNAVTWLYLHSGYAWVTITAQTGTTATGDVVNYIPEQIVSGSTNRWAHALFNDTDGWPTNVQFFRGRLVYSRGRTLAFSVTGVYDDFSTKDGPDLTVENGFVVTLAADRLDNIRWMIGSDKVLLVGSSSSELAISEQTTQQVFSASNFTDRPQSYYGARQVDPITVNDVIMFVQRAGKKLRADAYSINADKYTAEDLTVLSPQVTQAGIVDMDYQQEPDTMLWCVLADGKLGALTYNKERGIVAWTPQTIGGSTPDTDCGVVETVACISSPDTNRDDVWFVVRRRINGADVRYVEYLEDPTLYETSLPDAFFVDGGITYSGAPAKIITGLSHLEGETVQVMVDGSTQADCLVTGGQIVLLRPASKAQIGFQYKSQLQTMRPDGGVQTGSSQSFFRSVAQVWFLFEDTLGGKAGPDFDTLDFIPSMKPSQLIGVAKGVFSGWVQFEMPANQGTDGYVCFEQSQPFPATIQAITPRLEVSDD
jgi:hypothetical protein